MELRFTHAAEVVAQKFGRAAVEERIRGEINEMISREEPPRVSDLGFHVIDMAEFDPESPDTGFYLTPVRGEEDVLRVDAVEYEEFKLPATGPYAPGQPLEKMKVAMIPMPVTPEE